MKPLNLKAVSQNHKHFSGIVTCFALLIALLLLTSCGSKAVYEMNINLPGETWYFRNALNFDITIADTVNAHNLYFNIRHAGDYLYSNLFLFIDLQAPTGTLIRDTLEVVLADSRGRWLGQGSSGPFNMLVPYKGNVRFPYRGIYRLSVHHAMWNEELEGVAGFGVMVEKAQ